MRIHNRLSEPFNTSTGVLHGDTLAPFLFVIVLDFVMSSVPNDFGFVTDITKPEKLNDLGFADDISLLDNSETKAVDHISYVERNAAAVVLRVNYSTTKFMSLPAPGHSLQLPNNEMVEEVDDFKYLG